MRCSLPGTDAVDTRQEILFAWYKVLYKADNTIAIKPTVGSGDPLISPLAMPDDYNGCLLWFEDVHYKRNKLNWTVRVSGVRVFL